MTAYGAEPDRHGGDQRGEYTVYPLLERWRAYLADRKGVTQRHLRQTTRTVFRCLTACDIRAPADLEAHVEQIIEWLHDERKIRNQSASTFNHAVSDLRAFGAWLFRRGHVLRHPLLRLSRLRIDADRRRVRRAATADELARLIQAAHASTDVVYRLSGEERAMLYGTALLTGLRACELGGLTRLDLDFAADPPVIRVSAKLSKHRREDLIPLRRDLVERLQRWVVGRGFDQLWPGRWWKRAADMLRHDLRAAGIPYRDARGRYVDFHALRHTFITQVVRSGANVRVVQSLARHSNVTTTLSIYTHVDMKEAQDAVERLPSILA